MSQFAMRPLCRCGHVDSTHYGAPPDGGPGVHFGACTNPRCSCTKFRRRQHRRVDAAR